MLYGGAAGGGKSWALRWLALIRSLKIPEHKALILRKTYADLEMSQIRASLEEFPREVGRYIDNKKRWEFVNGSIIDFGYIDSDKDVYRYQCFSPDTELLTRKGFKNIKEVKVGELVATLNPETRTMEYQPITKFWEYDYDGDMIDVYQTQGVSFSVTPNHRVWYSTQKINKLRKTLAENLPSLFKIPQWNKWKGEEPPKEVVFSSDGNNGRTIKFDIETWVKFLGWYLAEGNCSKSRYAITITQLNKKGRKEIKKILDNVQGINYHETKKDFVLNNKALYKYLSQFGTSNYKYIPDDVKQYPPKLLELLLKALVEGDGTWYKDKQGVFVTSSKRLADDVSEIAIKCGYRPKLNYVENDNPKGSPFGQKRRWRVSLLYRNGKDTEVRKKRSLKRKHYKGKIYSVTVPPYHTVLIRHRGRIAWIGQSAEYELIAFDELTHFTEEQYTYLLSRLRTNKKDVQPIMRAASNPGGIGHNFVKARFIDPAEPYEIWKPERGGTRQFIPAKVYDNPHINQEDYIENLEALPEDTRKALLDGDWNVFGGQVFKEFDPKVHVITPFEVPTHWPKYMALDWGFTKPFAILWGAVASEDYKIGKQVIPKGSVVIYREYYGNQKGKTNAGLEMPAREVAWEIIKRENEPVHVRVADPATWAHRGHDGPSISEIFHEEGVYMMRADNDRLAGKMQIHDRLRLDEDGNPRLFFMDNCRHLIRTLPALPYDPRNTEDVDTDSEDHLLIRQPMLATA